MASRLDVLVKIATEGAKDLEGLGGKLQRVGFNATKFVTLPLVGAAAASFKFAADAEEATSKAETVFGDAFGSIADDAASLDDSFSEAQFLDTAGTLGAIAQGMGETKQESADLANQWVSMAQDFASFNNVDTEESLTAIRAALSGEFEPLKRFGVLLNVAKVEAKALEMGLIEEGQALDDNSRLLATNALILEGMGPALGDYERTAEGAANSTRNLGANAADAAASLGESLLPIGIQLISWAQGLFTWINQLPPGVKDLAVQALALAAAIGPVVFVGGKLISSFKAITTAFNIMKLALLANPFTALVAAVVAVAALIILNWDKIVASFKNLWKDIQKVVGGIADFLGDAWDAVVSVAAGAWSRVIAIIKGAINGVIDVINGLFGFLNGIQIGVPEINVGPVHVGGGVIDPFNIGLIPHLASGGIVTAPTLALIGERAPEAVIPLSQLGELGGGDTFVFNVEGEVRDEEALVDIFQRARRLERAMAWD